MLSRSVSEQLLFVSTIIIISFWIASAQRTATISDERSVCSGSVYLTPNDTLTLECNVNNTGSGEDFNSLQWVSTGPGGINTFVTSSTSTGLVGRYTVSLISIDNSPGSETIASNLTFTVTESDDGRMIRCITSGADDTDTCTLLVCTKPNSPTELMANSVGCDSIYLTWTAPTDTGGCTVSHTITVTPLNGVDSYRNIVTDNTNYTVNGLKTSQSYNFTVRSSNRAGRGGTSMTVTASTDFVPTSIPDKVSIDVCLLYNATGTYLNVSWKSPLISGPDTQCINNYLVSVNGSSPLMVDRGSSQVLFPLGDAEGNHTVNVSVSNTVGINVTEDHFDSRWFQNVTVDRGASQAILNVTTVRCLNTSENLTINLTSPNNNAQRNYTENTVIRFTLSSLIPGDNIDYTLQVVDPTETIGNGFTSFFMLTPLPSPASSSPSPSPTTGSIPTSTNTATISTMPSMPPSSPLADDSLPIAPIAGGVGGGVALLAVIFVLIGVGVFCVVKKKKNKTEVDLGKMRRDSDGPIALVDRQAAVPETGQALYQDPDTIQREKAPTTGDLYALPDKPRRNAPTTPPAAPHQPELATYQDPNTIQREQAPTGDLYALPEKKPVYSQVNKENKEQGIVYAELGLENPSSSGPGYNPNTVLYADVKQQ